MVEETIQTIKQAEQEAEEIVQMFPYDIVLGSVHAVRSRLGREPYSQINFSGFTADEIPSR